MSAPQSDPERAASGFPARLLLFLKGMAMGAADSVPGVSGGTIALIANVYEPLIHALKSLHPLQLGVLRRQGPVAFFRAIHGGFLLSLGLGVITALFAMANVVGYLLTEHREPLMGFFIGMVLASTWLLRGQVVNWQPSRLALLLAGVALTAGVSLLNPLAGSQALPWLFLCGMVAISAMVLPGLSGAFVLILLGVYEYVLAALRDLQWGVIIVFAAGCVLGLVGFSHLLSWTLYRFREATYAFLIGMLAASVIVLWPWRSGRLPGPVDGTEWMPVLLSVVAGGALIVGFERAAGRRLSG